MPTLRKKYHDLGNKINNALLFIGTVKKDISRIKPDDARLRGAVKDCSAAEQELLVLGRELDVLKSITYRLVDPNREIGSITEEFQAGNQNIRILFVDDEVQLCGLLKRNYDAKGFKVEIAVTFDEARQKVQEFAPHILVLDLYLDQGMEGVDVLRFARKADPAIKCLVVSREFDDGRLKEIRKLGCEDVLRKPVTADELDAKINGLIASIRA
jgi:CheY-like chemotaxis protein